MRVLQEWERFQPLGRFSKGKSETLRLTNLHNGYSHPHTQIVVNASPHLWLCVVIETGNKQITYRITNQVLGTVIIVNKLPKGVRVGVRNIGPSWNNTPPPKLIVERIAAEEVQS